MAWFSSFFSSYKDKTPDNMDMDNEREKEKEQERERERKKEKERDGRERIGGASSFTLHSRSSAAEIIEKLQQALRSLNIVFQATHTTSLIAQYDGPDGTYFFFFSFVAAC